MLSVDTSNTGTMQPHLHPHPHHHHHSSATSPRFLDDYMRELKDGRIRTHKDALRHFSVRYSSFTQPPAQYPRDAPIPACALAEEGFHFDSHLQLIRCCECAFTCDDLKQDHITRLLHAHLDAGPTCPQARLSLELNSALLLSSSSQTPAASLLPSPALPAANTISPMDVSPTPASNMMSSPRSQAAKTNKAKNAFLQQENRLKSFEGLNLLLSVADLVEDGFYRVVADPIKSTPAAASTATTASPGSSKTVSGPSVSPVPGKGGSTPSGGSGGSSSLLLTSVDQAETAASAPTAAEPSHVMRIASLVPACVHVRCAFCGYECLLHKNSVLNTMFHSPFEEHRRKSAAVCRQLNKSLTIAADSAASAASKLLERRLAWLQALLDLDALSPDARRRRALDTLTVQPAASSGSDDVTVSKMPKVIEQLLIEETAAKTNAGGLPAGPGSSAASVRYEPNAAQFGQLKDLLHNSDNVISERAFHPTYANIQARLDSFRDWPATMSQQPQDLARAGFYYYGIKDMVKCFFCNGGLKNWDHHDDPYEDHVRWFPKCQYIRQLVGSQYVEQVREKYKGQDSGFTNANAGASADDLLLGKSTAAAASSLSSLSASSLTDNSLLSGEAAPEPAANVVKRPASPRTLNSRLDLAIVRKLNDQNILSRDSIKGAIEAKLATTIVAGQQPPAAQQPTGSDDFKSPIELARTCFETERARKERVEALQSFCNMLVCYVSPHTTVASLADVFAIKYDISPNSIKIIREDNQTEKRCVAILSLKKRDEDKLARIYADLNGKPFPSNSPEAAPVTVVRTNWTEILPRVKQLLNKPASISSATVASQPAEESNKTTTSEASASPGLSDNVPKFPAPKDDAAAAAAARMEEREEDADTTNQLKEENERLRGERLCVVCLDKEKNVLFLPCAHLAACLDCSLSLEKCPMCRTKIQATVRTFP